MWGIHRGAAMLNDGKLDIEGAVASGGPAVPPTQTAQKKDVTLPQTPGSDDDKNEAEVRVQVVPTLGICPSPRESASICWTPDGALLFGEPPSALSLSAHHTTTGVSQSALAYLCSPPARVGPG